MWEKELRMLDKVRNKSRKGIVVVMTLVNWMDVDTLEWLLIGPLGNEIIRFTFVIQTQCYTKENAPPYTGRSPSSSFINTIKDTDDRILFDCRRVSWKTNFVSCSSLHATLLVPLLWNKSPFYRIVYACACVCVLCLVCWWRVNT